MTPPTLPFFRRFSLFILVFSLLGATASCSAPRETTEPSETNAPSPMVAAAPMAGAACARTVKADVVVLEQTLPMNRLGAVLKTGQIFALRRDVVPSSAPQTTNGWDGGPYSLQQLKAAGAGNVRLRSGKRPRPLVLRANIGDCLRIRFTNFLSTNLTGSVRAGFHVAGLELVKSSPSQPGISSDASWVGANNPPSENPETTGSFAQIDSTVTYTYYAGDEGIYYAYSGAGDLTSEANSGLFATVNVQPKTAEWYRSQVRDTDLKLATFRYGQFITQNPDSLSFTPPSGTVTMTLTPKTYQATELEQYAPLAPGDETYTLTTFIHASQTVNTANVVVKAPDAFGLRFLNTLDTRHPIVNYEAVYPDTLFGLATDPTGGRAGKPVLNMLDADHNIIYSDLTAIITGPNAGRFSYSYDSPLFYENPASPDRRQPYREFTIMYHEYPQTPGTLAPVQAFEILDQTAYQAGQDHFGINYGFASIGAEIVANRLHVGPEGINKDEVDLKFEEFFLSSWAIGDPAILVNIPASETLPGESHAGQRATAPFYPDDPSNVYHSYMRDHVKFRIMNASAAGDSHVHHQHAHQWLHSPNSDDSHYLDSQLITPGSTYTLEMVYNGSGNRNQTVGDSIFHCHFYPHFAQGMWSLWRVHDTFEKGTACEMNSELAIKDTLLTNPTNVTNVFCADSTGQPYPRPAIGARALPDGELVRGSWIPAVVPVPTIAMAPMPAEVHLAPPGDTLRIGGRSISMAGRRAIVVPEPDGTYKNPGYPFYIPGIGGHRPPHPPLDMAWEESAPGQPYYADSAPLDTVYLDGGLPRHLVLDGLIYREAHTRWDFTKDFVVIKDTLLAVGSDTLHAEAVTQGNLIAFELPEGGTAVEKAAMRANAQRTHASYLPNGDPGNFILNGLPPIHGAPYAEPGVSDDGNSTFNTRRYKAANIELDVVLNKKGWHYPQQRIITLWNDVAPTIQGERPPQPFFFRSNTGETVDYWHTNLMPNYYELDDFQVRTPTDVIGQHIHLVKFDVTSSDGATNGFNYEDATFSPEEIIERIVGVNQVGGLYGFDAATDFVDTTRQQTLRVKKCGIDTYKLDPNRSSTGNCIFGVPADSVFLVYDPANPSGGQWATPYDGAMTTIQRWDTDPLLNDLGFDRTLRTVFTHDHLSPSTHQQAGLYAGLVVEPSDSRWLDPVTGEPLYNTITPSLWRQRRTPPGDPNPQFRYTYSPPADPENWRPIIRKDGGPTNWQAIIETADPEDSYREFMLEFQDFQLAYTRTSKETMTSLEYQIYFATPMVRTATDTFFVDFNNGVIPDSLRKVFIANGITLSPNATIAPDSADASGNNVAWTITEPADASGAPDEGQIYRLVSPTGNPNIDIYTLTLDSWSDYEKAIQAPSNNTQITGSQSPNCGSNNLKCAPLATLVSTGGRVGTYSLNYRNEPLPLRVNRDKGLTRPPGMSLADSLKAIDLSYAFSSIQRLDPPLNRQPPLGQVINAPDGTLCPPSDGPGLEIHGPFCYPKVALTPGMQDFDPFTPLLRAYENDKVQIRTLVGAHTLSHSFELFGLNWEYEPSWANSGKTSVQGMGISEHFEMLFTLPTTDSDSLNQFSDFLYAADAGTDGLSNGIWGILRSYDLAQAKDSLVALPNNPVGPIPSIDYNPPTDADTIRYEIVATTARQAYADGAIPYNLRGQTTVNGTNDSRAEFNSTTLTDPNGLVYVMADSVRNGKTIANALTEPLILRAAAGTWIEITLHNCFAVADTVFKTPLQAAPPVYGPPQTQIINTNNQIKLFASTQVGLHPQVVSYDVPTAANGINVGFNPVQTVPPSSVSSDLAKCLNPTTAAEQAAADSSTVTYYWYAGELTLDERGRTVRTPMEFGAINLLASDPLMQHKYGLVGSLIIEPEGSAWVLDDSTFAAATVTKADGSTFRDFVVLWQLDLSSSSNVTSAVNYRTEPLSYRYQGAPSPPITTTNEGQARFFSNTQVWTNTLNIFSGDPKTRIYDAAAGMPTRFRMLYTRGLGRKTQVLMLNGHNWQEAPYVNDSREIGDNAASQQFGSQQITSDQAFNLVLESAGGTFEVPGDYLYHMYQDETNGDWGLFRVKDSLYISKAYLNPISNELTVMVKSNTVSQNDPIAISIDDTKAGDATFMEQEDAWVFGPAVVSGTAVCDLVEAAANGQTSTVRLAPCKNY